MINFDKDFWDALNTLVTSSKIIIDRHKGSFHPRYENVKYQVDYGYLQDTASPDGAGIDVWRGSLKNEIVNAVICTVDLVKKDSEIKLLIGCTDEEIQYIYNFHNSTDFMKGILIKNGDFK